MSSRAISRMRGFVVLMAAAACGPSGPDADSPITITPGHLNTMPLDAPFMVPATFSDTSNQSPWSYTVRWGDGNRSTGSTTTQGTIPATHTYESPGNYRIDLTVTNQRGTSATATLTLTTTDPVLLAAGDIGDCQRQGDDQTAALLDTMPGVVVPLGDNAYLDGTLEQFNECYGPSWGRHKFRTRPVVGNHDYHTPDAAGYYAYFGPAAGDPATGYYTYELGSWLVIVLNTGTDRPVLMEAGSAQEQWLRQQLATHTHECVLAVMHHPRFTTTEGRSTAGHLEAFWNALYEYGADLVVAGHDHNYQRFAPQRPDGTPDPSHGLRQFTVGTGGGEGLYGFAPIPPESNLEVRDSKTWGVLQLTLKSGGYDWRFTPVAGATFTDSGSGTCHGRPM